MMVKFYSVTRSDEFSKELKKLQRKYRSLEEDLEAFIHTQLYLFHKLQVDNGGLVQINNLGFEEPQIFKAKKFACKALKGRGGKSGIRVIYAYKSKEDEVHLLEIYFKGNKEGEDRERIKRKYAGYMISPT